MKRSEIVEQMRKNYDDGLPFMVSFSGGRTSAYMLRLMLDYFDNERIVVCFANTGKEHEKTLDFVRDVEENWKVNINWIEYDPDAEGKFRVTNYIDASRNGEPFAKVIENHGFIPNPVMRFCTGWVLAKLPNRKLN